MPPSPGSPPAPPVSPPSPPTCDALCGVDLGGKVQYGSCVPGGSAGAACGSVGGEWAGTLAVGCSNDGCYCCVSKDGGVTPEPPTVPEPPAPSGSPGPPPSPSGTPPPPVPSPPPPASFYLASNGVTVMCPGVNVNDTFDIGGVTYTKRDRNGLLGLVQDSSKWPELSTSCTTGVDDMSYMWVLTSPAVRSPAPTRSRPRSLRASLARSPGSITPRSSIRTSAAGS